MGSAEDHTQPLCGGGGGGVPLASLKSLLISGKSQAFVNLEQQVCDEHAPQLSMTTGGWGGEKWGAAPAILGASCGFYLHAQRTTHKTFQTTASP